MGPRETLVVPTMNRDGHPTGLGWLSLILFGLSFCVPVNTISVGYGTTRLAEPDVLHGPAAIATTLVILAYSAFFSRFFYLAEFLAVPAILIAFASTFPWIWAIHIGMILWVASMPCLVIAANKCDAYRDRAL